jgi:invasion protein IalB
MMMKATTLLASAVLALGLSAGAAAAQQSPPETKRIGAFQVRCFAIKSMAPCDLYEDRVDNQTGQRVVSFSLAYVPSGNRYILQVAVPLGISLEKGVVITGGGFTSPTLPVRRCDQTGCFVEAPVAKELIDALAKAGSDAKIRVVPDGRPAFDFPFSFDGFTAAHDDMVASNKAKAISPQELQAAQAAAAAQPAK